MCHINKSYVHESCLLPLPPMYMNHVIRDTHHSYVKSLIGMTHDSFMYDMIYVIGGRGRRVRSGVHMKHDSFI